MTSFLRHNCDIIIATEDINFRTNVFRLNEEFFVFNLIEYFRFIYSREELLQTEFDILKTITMKKQILNTCTKILTLDIDSNVKEQELYFSFQCKEHYKKVEVYINNLLFKYDKDKTQLTEAELFICEILSINSSVEDFINRDFDLMLDLSEPLRYYYRKLNWLEYRFKHFFYLLTTENIITMNEYHIDFIIFLLQFNYNVFHFYYDYNMSLFSTNKTTKEHDYIINKSLQETDNLFNNTFHFIDNFNEKKNVSNFIDLIKTLQFTYSNDLYRRKTLPENSTNYRNSYGMVYNIFSTHSKASTLFTWPKFMSTNDNESESLFVFVSPSSSNSAFYCDYENEMLNLFYLPLFVNAFFKVSLRTSNFKDNEHKYGRFFSMDNSYIYRELDYDKDEKIYSFNPNQAFNYNKNWKWPKKE